MEEPTTVQIEKKTRKRLKDLRITKRETYDEIINRLMMMQLTQKIKIEPTEEQEEVLTSLSEVCRLLYNFSLEERIEDWKKNKNNQRKTETILHILNSRISCLS